MADTMAEATHTWGGYGGERDMAIRRATWALALAACAFAAFHGVVYKPGGDFGVFYRAADRALRGEALYLLSDGTMPFKYAPAAALVLAPLALFPAWVARALWAVASVLATLRVLNLAAQSTGQTRPLAAHALVLALGAPFLLHMFALGQCDVFLLWLLLESESVATSKPWFSGVLWGVAVLFKPPYLIFLAGAVVFFEHRRLGALLSTVAVGLAAPILAFGPDRGIALHAEWAELLRVTTPAALCSPQNQGVLALACRTHGAWDPGSEPALPIAAAIGAFTLLAAGVAVMLVRKRDSRDSRLLATATQCFLAAFLSPLCWWTNLMGLIPLAYWLARIALGEPRPVLRSSARTIAALGVIAGLFNGDLIGRDLFERLLALRHFAWQGLFLFLATTALVAVATRSRPLTAAASAGLST